MVLRDAPSLGSRLVGDYVMEFLRLKSIEQADPANTETHFCWFSLQAAARHQCPYLVKRYEKEFINHGGNSEWLNGVDYTPPKLRAIYDINKILAHRPWLLRKEHIEVGPGTLATLSMNI